MNTSGEKNSGAITDNNSKSMSVLKAAWIIAVVTIISKLIGFIRDIIIANYYGATLVAVACR